MNQLNRRGQKFLPALFFVSTLLLGSGQVYSQDNVKFSGKIVQPNSDSIVVYSKTFKKVVSLKEDGTFSASLGIDQPGFYRIFDGTESASIYLEPNYQSSLYLETEMFDETIRMEGDGAMLSNFFFKKYLDEESSIYPMLGELDSNQFKIFFDSLETKYYADLKVMSLSETGFKSGEERSKQLLGNINASYAFAQELKLLDRFIGQPLEEFKFELVDGKTISTKDLNGKPIYIDVWATWCGPCVGEIPDLKELEAAYGEQIHFLSISVDRQKDRQKWVDMIDEKELKGTQVIADEAFNSDFVKTYKIGGIPRFMLIDGEGIIVSANAPRPSSNEVIKEELNKLVAE